MCPQPTHTARCCPPVDKSENQAAALRELQTSRCPCAPGRRGTPLRASESRTRTEGGVGSRASAGVGRGRTDGLLGGGMGRGDPPPRGSSGLGERRAAQTGSLVCPLASKWIPQWALGRPVKAPNTQEGWEGEGREGGRGVGDRSWNHRRPLPPAGSGRRLWGPACRRPIPIWAQPLDGLGGESKMGVGCYPQCGSRGPTLGPKGTREAAAHPLLSCQAPSREDQGRRPSEMPEGSAPAAPQG